MEVDLASTYNIAIPAEKAIGATAAEMQKAILDIEKSAAAVEKVEAAEAEAIAAAGKITLWTKGSFAEGMI